MRILLIGGLVASASAIWPFATTKKADTQRAIGPVFHSRSFGHSTDVCSPPADALARSYAAPRRFPFPPWRLVLETKPGTCNLYGSRRICHDFSSGDHFEPEFHVREAIASHLLHCNTKPCRALDIGMSTGYMSAMMAALGAHVTSVERQSDMIAAYEETAKVNCWTDRVSLINALVGYDVSPRATYNDPGRDMGRPLSDGYGDKRQLPKIPIVDIETLLTNKWFDFVKIDIDSIDC